MKENKPIRSSTCHCINIRRAANAVTSYYDKWLSEAGLTLNQYSLLSNIHKIEPCSVAALSRCVRLERTTLVRNLKLLRSMGWICDEADPGNRKSKIRLTESGVEKIQMAKPCWEKAQTGIEERLGKDAMRKLTEALLLLETTSQQEHI